ncbi:hypothetical protein FJZ19_05480 [Candidatus Pacearchaeota archaeon]|nr:hypothetical protein [Candidatus Pacearchaeota archaeon]
MKIAYENIRQKLKEIEKLAFKSFVDSRDYICAVFALNVSEHDSDELGLLDRLRAKREISQLRKKICNQAMLWETAQAEVAINRRGDFSTGQAFLEQAKEYARMGCLELHPATIRIEERIIDYTNH